MIYTYANDARIHECITYLTRITGIDSIPVLCGCLRLCVVGLTDYVTRVMMEDTYTYAVADERILNSSLGTVGMWVHHAQGSKEASPGKLSTC